MKKGDMVHAVAVTGEIGTGFYALTSETTGSHLVENFRTEDGQFADFVWAERVGVAN